MLVIYGMHIFFGSMATSDRFDYFGMSHFIKEFQISPLYLRWKRTMSHYGNLKIAWLDGLLEYPVTKDLYTYSIKSPTL
jgi:hypothetical protein